MKPHPMTRAADSPLKVTPCGRWKVGDRVREVYTKPGFSDVFTIYRINKAIMATSDDGRTIRQFDIRAYDIRPEESRGTVRLTPSGFVTSPGL